MAKSQNQKLKLLYIAKYLLENTDENHSVTLNQIIIELKKYGISAERKSLYSDIEALRVFGIDIATVKNKTVGYFIASRDFELPELKLLVDSVQSSKFITQKKTLTLIKKIESLTGKYEAQELQRQVYVRNRVKSMNESIYYNVDEISDAINSDKVINFKYFEYTAEKERRYRHDGAVYEVSPFALMWDDENYYMLAWDDAAKKLKHYRVDKMSNISLKDSTRFGKDEFADVDMSVYSNKIFGMFTGKEKKVTIRFAEHLAGAVIDRFGRDIIMVRYNDYFTVTIDAAVSPQFYAWIFGFGTEAEVISPPEVREEMKKQAESVYRAYL